MVANGSNCDKEEQTISEEKIVATNPQIVATIETEEKGVVDAQLIAKVDSLTSELCDMHLKRLKKLIQPDFSNLEKKRGVETTVRKRILDREADINYLLENSIPSESVRKEMDVLKKTIAQKLNRVGAVTA